MKAVLAPQHFLVAQSLGANFNSAPVNVLQSDVVSIQLNYSGTAPTGAIVVQGSLDGVNYAAIPVQLGTASVVTIPLPGTVTPILVNISNFNVQFMRVNYTFTSGSGTIDGYISYKRIGD